MRARLSRIGRWRAELMVAPLVLLLCGCLATPFEPGGLHLTTASGLRIDDIQVGEGTPARRGDEVTIHYTIWLADGTQIDTSIGLRPFEFPVGQRIVIQGLDQGIRGMQVGGDRRLVLPPSLGYGERGYPPVVPANATLVLRVRLLKINGYDGKRRTPNAHILTSVSGIKAES